MWNEVKTCTSVTSHIKLKLPFYNFSLLLILKFTNHLSSCRNNVNSLGTLKNIEYLKNVMHVCETSFVL